MDIANSPADLEAQLQANVTLRPPIPLEYRVAMPEHIRQIQELTQKRAAEAEEGESFWSHTVTEVAVAYGAQAGLAYRYELIVQSLQDRASYLDTIFDLKHFVHQGKIFLPSVELVIAKSEVISDTEVAEVNAQYTIEEEAKLVTVAPTWRDYLIRSFPQPKLPPVGGLPKNKTEQELWREGIARGWNLGVRQAEAQFGDMLAELLRDIRGRQLFLDLHRMNILSLPELDRSERGFTFKDRTMNSGEVVYTLTQPTNWLPADNWRAFWGAPYHVDYDKVLREAAVHE